MSLEQNDTNKKPKINDANNQQQKKGPELFKQISQHCGDTALWGHFLTAT